MRLLRLTLLSCAALACCAATAAAQPGPAVARLVFPVVGGSSYGNDWGDARGTGSHEGIDIMAARRAPAVAAEGGTVEFWTTSANAGCMLYLHGDSGTDYWYIHLNNDLGEGNDNRGRCVPGVSYAAGLADGARVEAGELVGYVGDSGDANGISPHLHFEVHPDGGAPVNPYRHLRRAQQLLFPARAGATFTLSLSGTVLEVGAGKLELRVDGLRVWPWRTTVPELDRTLVVKLGAGALVRAARVGGSTVSRGADGLTGREVVILTAPAPASLAAQRGDDGALTAASVAVA
jgi:hypothetical protein